MVWIGSLCTAVGAAVIVSYTISNYRLRRKGEAAVWWGGWVLGAVGMSLTGLGWGILALVGPHYDIPALRPAGVIISIFAGLLYFLSAARVGRLRARKRFNLGLRTDGIYRLVRHPQALALCVLAVGIGLATLSQPYLRALPLIAGFWIAYTYFEERFELIPAYGEQYQRYIRTTGRLLPSVCSLRQFLQEESGKTEIRRGKLGRPHKPGLGPTLSL
jgi:protein-S-isoprenylcysteine O-methyltransferase Ste14